MKTRSFILFFTLASVFSVFAQVVVTTPAFPMETDSITITFDASKASNTGLLNYTGTVYSHTGVITNLSSGQWAHVIGAWGNNTTQPALTRLGTNLYQLKIGYPRTFYSVTNNAEHILKLAFVFRSADGTKQTEDIMVTIYQGGLSLVVNSPTVAVEYGDPLRSPVFAKQSDTVKIKATAVELNTKIQSMTLFVNGSQVSQTNQNVINYNLLASNYSSGAQTIKIVAVDTASMKDSSQFVVFVNPQVVNAAPPAGTMAGITYNSATSVTFALFAPYKDFVYLIGSFNDWKVNQNYFLKKNQVSADSVMWWITLDGITPGMESTFQYLVDGNIRIADPYSEKVLDPWNDQYITSTTYPGLIPYPAGKTSNIVSVIQTSQSPYQWQITNFQKPAKTDLVVYELLIRDFLASHDYKTLTDTLNYLKTLGVNCIELMPVMEFEGNESWGYNPSFHLALDKYYGPKNEFKKFIDKAHSLGIAVVMDMVLNHAFGLNPLVRLYWDGTNNRPAANNPWFNQVAKHDFNVGYDFNHESIHTKNYVDRVNKYWMTEYKIDGFRYDLSKGFTQNNTLGNTGAWGMYDQSRINLLKRMADKIWEVNSNAYVILEHFAENSEETVLANYGMMLWGNLNSKYNEATMGWHESGKSDFSWGSYKARGWNNPNLVTYMESHDEERLMFKNISYGNSSGSYNIKDLRESLNRIKLAGAFFFTIPGPKMIWQFGELGYDISIDVPCRVCNKPIKWDYYTDAKRKNLYKVFSALTKLKVEYPAFESTNYTLDVSGSLKRITIYHSSMDVNIIGNFGVTPASMNPVFSKTGRWYDFFSGDSVEVTNVSNPINLQPGEFHIYTTAKTFTPQQGILLDVENEKNISLTDYTLEQNYPNPFNPSTIIRFALPKGDFVTLKVYDVLGNEVKTLYRGEKPAGVYEVEFNAAGLSSGVYFYTLNTGNFNQTRKMIITK